MKKKKLITLASKPTYQGYSYAFKVAIVDRIEQGQISQNQAAKEYDVSRSAIQKWVKKNGNLDKKLRSMGGKSPKQEIAELKKKLKEAETAALIWKTAVEILEEDFQIDAKKVLNRIPKRSFEKDGKKVSVTKVCSQLGCSRQTFYNINHRKTEQDNSTKIMKDKVIKIRKDQARIGGRKLIYLLQEDFKKAGIKIGRDKFFKFLKNQYLLVKRKKNRTITTRSYKRFRQHPNLY